MGVPQEEFEFDGTLDDFFNWYARARESPKEQAVFAQHFPPPKNLTLGPWSSQQPAGFAAHVRANVNAG